MFTKKGFPVLTGALFYCLFSLGKKLIPIDLVDFLSKDEESILPLAKYSASKKD